MAEHTRAHLWLNTGISILAVVVSAFSGVISWQSASLKREDLGFTINPTYSCTVEFHKEGDGGALSVCWIVMMTNRSNSRLSIVRAQAFETTGGNAVFRSGFRMLEDMHGSLVGLPINLDGGESAQYLMRIPIAVPVSIAALVEKSPDNSSLYQLKRSAQEVGLDIVGNVVRVHYYDETKQSGTVSWDSSMNVSTGEIRFYTGRGNKFTATMSFPPIFHFD